MSIFDIIKQKVNILNVISEYVTLKKIGSYYKGRCPFHSEKTASFTISPGKEIFYCFGCQLGGDVISFISKIESCSQMEAAKIITEKYNIDLPNYNFNLESFDEKKKYIFTHEIFLKWAQNNLVNTRDAKTYLESRSINQESIEKFQIGFMPSGQQAIKDLVFFAQKHNVLASDLIEVKILFSGQYGMYSPFEDRIIFSIKDHLGNLCGLGGRVIKKDDERAKYYNSHDNKFFNKGSLLFGLNLAKKAMQQKNAVFLVEGYVDVIIMSQYGFNHTVATLGTACTKEHLTLLSRYSNRLYVLYDQDTAGQKAINRLIESCWQSNIDLYVISLPQNEDPASFLPKGYDLKSLILKAKDIFKFYIDNLKIDFKNIGINEKIRAISKIISIIANVTDQLKRNILLRQASEAFDIEFEILKQKLKLDHLPESIDHKKDLVSIAIDEKNSTEVIDTTKIGKLEKKIISAIINYPEKISDMLQDDISFLMVLLPTAIKELFVKLVDKAELTEFEKSIVSKIIIEANDNSPIEQLILSLYKKQWKILIDDIKFKIEQAEKNGDKALINKLLDDLELLKKKILKRNLNV